MSKKPNKKVQKTQKKSTAQNSNSPKNIEAQERQKAAIRQRARKEKLKKAGIIAVIIVLILGLGIPTAALMSLQ